MVNTDIPQLLADRISLGNDSLVYVSSIQSSSIHSPLSSPFDALGLEQYISFREKKLSSTSYVAKDRSELNSIPLNVEDLCIGHFDTLGIAGISFKKYQSLKTLVIGINLFIEVFRFGIKDLPSLQSIEVGDYSFTLVSYFTLSGLSDSMK